MLVVAVLTHKSNYAMVSITVFIKTLFYAVEKLKNLKMDDIYWGIRKITEGKTNQHY